jgi:hypothetical protein
MLTFREAHFGFFPVPLGIFIKGEKHVALNDIKIQLEGKEETVVIGKGGLELAENDDSWICRFMSTVFAPVFRLLWRE